MSSTRSTVLAAGAALLLLLLVITLGGCRTRPASRPVDTEEPFHPSDVALIGHTGLPQLVEFYHPA